MKIKNFFLAGLIVMLGLTACSKDNHESEVNKVRSEASTYMKLWLIGEPNGGSAYNQTRTAPGNFGTETGSVGENTISSALVLLADEEGNIQKSVTPQLLTPTETGVYTSPFEIEPGTYYVYVVGNPTEELKSWSAGESVSDRTIIDVTESAMSNYYAKNGTFLMFNESNGTDDVQGQKIVVTEENIFGNPATGDGAIKLDRLAAKITSTTAKKVDYSGFELSEINNVELKGFTLLNGIHLSYLQQRWAEPKQVTPPYQNKLITPDYEYYQFYNTFEQYASITEDAVSDLSKKTTWNNNPVYCMENGTEIGIGEILLGTATGIIYRWQAHNPKSDKRAGHNCFYNYDGKYYHTLEAIQKDYPVVFNADGEITNDTQKLKDLAAAALLLRNNPEKFRAKYNIMVYENGIMYYTYYIQDQNHVNEDQHPYFAVMRNTVYKLNVTKLLKIGNDIPGGWNPDPAPAPASGPYMQVTVDVNDWVISSEGDITLE